MMRWDLLINVDAAGVETFSVPISVRYTLLAFPPGGGDPSVSYAWLDNEGVLFRRGEQIGLVDRVPVVTSIDALGVHKLDSRWIGSSPFKDNLISVPSTGEIFRITEIVEDKGYGVMCKLSKDVPDSVLDSGAPNSQPWPHYDWEA